MMNEDINKNIDFKKKIIDRIKREHINYHETISDSFNNEYKYITKISYNNKMCKKELFITAPKYTDDTMLEQTYKLSHELGHHNLNKNLSPFLFRLYNMNNMIVMNIIERKAWTEAEKICNNENIPIKNNFYLIKQKCLNTYNNSLKISIKSGFNIGINIIKVYYMILICCYLLYKITNENIVDLFGVMQYLKIDNSKNVGQYAITIWIVYIISYSITALIKKIKSVKL